MLRISMLATSDFLKDVFATNKFPALPEPFAF